jgi:hypothetical protein
MGRVLPFSRQSLTADEWHFLLSSEAIYPRNLHFVA